MSFDKTVKVGVVGTGMIGMSLATLFTGNGYETYVLSMGKELSERGLAAYHENFEVLTGRGLVTKEQAALIEKKLHITEDYADLADVEMVMEAVLEKIEVKANVYEMVEKYCPNVKVIASTSSAISPDDLSATAHAYADRIVVAHPFNPPHIVPFVEMVKAAGTKDEALKFAYDLLESCGRKVCVMKKSAAGFIANRLQHALLREAFYMVNEGLCDARDIDKALMYSLMPRYTSVGLFEHQDAAGLDLVYNIEKYMLPHLCDEHTVPAVVQRAVEEGNLGQKTGKGVYEWDADSIADFKVRASAPFWGYFNWDLPEA